jgi:hypothetical protein
LLAISHDDERGRRDGGGSRQAGARRRCPFPRALREPAEKLQLGAARVLELVDEEEAYASFLQRADGRIAREQIAREAGEIVEIEGGRPSLLGAIPPLGLAGEQGELSREPARSNLRVGIEQRLARVADPSARLACAGDDSRQ